MNEYNESLTSEFIERYKVLERIEENNRDIFNRVKNEYYKEFDMFRHIRNDISHNTVGNTYPIAVSKKTLELLNYFINKMECKAYDLATKRKDLTFITLDTPLYKVIDTINKKHYSYIPVFHEETLIGVASRKTIVSILADSKNGITYDKNTLAKEYEKSFRNQDNPDEYFVFISKATLGYDAKKLIQKIDNGRKCGALFITENGKTNEKIIGMLTARDLLEL